MNKQIKIELSRDELYCVLFTLQFIGKHINTLKLPVTEFLYTRLFYIRTREVWNKSPLDKEQFDIYISAIEFEYIHIFTWNRASFMIHNQKELAVFNSIKDKIKKSLDN